MAADFYLLQAELPKLHIQELALIMRIDLGAELIWYALWLVVVLSWGLAPCIY